MNRYQPLSRRTAATAFAAALLATVFSVGSVFALIHSATSAPAHATLAGGAGATLVAVR